MSVDVICLFIAHFNFDVRLGCTLKLKRGMFALKKTSWELFSLSELVFCYLLQTWRVNLLLPLGWHRAKMR